MSKKSQKIWFIVLVSIFATLWVASMVMVSIAAFNETTTLAIENWYKEINTDPNAIGQVEEKTLNLFNVSAWALALSTAGLLIVLLFTELKKKYNNKKR